MLSIQEIMSTDVITVNPNTPVYEALELLNRNKISGLPVVSDTKQVVGILTEKDVLRILVEKDIAAKNTVEDFMTTDVICFNENDDAIEICKFFINSNIRRVPILKDGHLAGVVSRRDIVKVILDAKSKFSDMKFG